MNCHDFKTHLAAFLDDEVSVKIRVLCENHLSNCEPCLKLWHETANSNFHLSAAAAHAISVGILADTNSDSCLACEESLCEFTDGSIEPEKRQYVKLHLDHCKDCQAIAETLAALELALPELAEAEPAVDLTEKILRLTVAEPARFGRRNWLKQFDFSISFQLLLRRPRFSMEASFAITLLWTLMFGLPTTLTIDAEAESLAIVDTTQVQRRLVSAQSNLNQRVSKIPELVNERMDSLGSISTQLLENGLDVGQQNGRGAWQGILSWFRELELSLEDIPNELIFLRKETRDE